MTGSPVRGDEPGLGLSRRRLLLTGAGLVSAAGLGAIVWQAAGSRPAPSLPRTVAAPDAAVRPVQVSAAQVRRAPARRPIWRAGLAVPRPQVMAAADGAVYVAGDQGVDWSPGAQETVQALNAADGHRMWTFTVPTGLRNEGVLDPPGLAAAGGRVYAAMNNVTCLRADGGAKVWSVQAPFTSFFAAGPAAVYAVQVTMFALRGRDGTQLWSYPANAGADPSPILVNGVIYMFGGGPSGQPLVLAIRASDGVLLWQAPIPSPGSLACDGQVVCAVSGSDVQMPGNSGPTPTQLSTWRARDGKLLYRSAANAGFSGTPTVTAGIACAFKSGGVAALDAGTGRTLWSYAGASSAPVAANGRIYTSTPAGALVAMNTGDGTPVWQCPVRITLGPLVAGGSVFICDDTALYAFPA